MTNKVLETIRANAEELRGEAAKAEKLGKLTDRTVEIMQEAQVMRMFQPAEYGGLESRPREFAEAVMELAALDPAAGWVMGVVGVHPWQLAFNDPRVQEEVWGEDSSIWMASPYMPGGLAVPVEGGYKFSGKWGFSSGTDHCKWVFLGGMLADADGAMAMPPTMVHVIIPRSEYEIVEDSWDVLGLRGTGSKDLIIKDTFIPEYRLMTWDDVIEGTGQERSGRTQTLYQMPWSNMFPLGITAATVGICEGLLQAAQDYQRDRINAMGTAVKDDPYTMFLFGDAAADIRAARAELLANSDRFWDMTERGEKPDFAQRAEGRATQVAASWRAVRAANEIFARCGGVALHMDKPMQRYFRDAQAGLHHAIHSPGTVYHAAALSDLGADPQGPLRAMI